MAETKNLYQRLATIMTELTAIEKRGWNAAQSYSFVEQSMVVATLRPLLGAHGVVITSDLLGFEEIPNASGKGSYCTVSMEYRIVNADNPEDFTVQKWSGASSDFSDKALNKAMTACFKTFLMKLFFISDADPDADQGEQPTQRMTQTNSSTYKAPTTKNVAYTNKPFVPKAEDPIPEVVPQRPIASHEDLVSRTMIWQKGWVKLQGFTAEGEDENSINNMDNSRLMTFGALLRSRVEYVQALDNAHVDESIRAKVIADIPQLTKAQIDAETKKIAAKQP